MTPKKTLQERERELQALLTTPAGRKALEELEAGYQASGDKVRPGRASIITYLLVHEREHGIIAG